MRAERKRLQLARMIDTGAHLRLGGVIYVQKRGAYARTLPSPPHNKEHDQTVVPGLEERQLAVVSQPKDEGGPEGGGVRSRQTGNTSRGDDKQGGDNTVDGQMLKISLAKNTGVYSEEALAERMAHLLSQR